VRRDTEQLRWTLLKWAREDASRHAAFRTLALGAHRASRSAIAAPQQQGSQVEGWAGISNSSSGLQSQEQELATSSGQFACVRAPRGLSCLSVEGLRRIVAGYLGLTTGKGRRTMRELALHLEAIMDDGSSMEEDEDDN